ncbi:MAG: hypothetical protein AAFM91_17665 [Pseudomonadota bacterium]
MAVELEEFVQAPLRATNEWSEVRKLANRLLIELNSEVTLKGIIEANSPGTPSSEVQAAFRPAAESLGFQSEKKGLFDNTIAGLRPDYYLAIDGVGVILEVERGKTTTNNMDLLDFWKCHICDVASYLFLLVPKELRHNETMRPKKEFIAVRRRMAQFFEPANYTNVRGLCLFGY